MKAMPRYQARMSAKGQVTIPSAVRERLGLKAGDMVDFHVDEADHAVRIGTGNESVSDRQEGYHMPGLNEAAAEYIAGPAQTGRHSIFDHLDELTLPSLGRPLTQADIDAAIGEAMEEQEQRIRNQRRP
jgi:AbrB family looped-hinge helix DNA binding protein